MIYNCVTTFIEESLNYSNTICDRQSVQKIYLTLPIYGTKAYLRGSMGKKRNFEFYFFICHSYTPMMYLSNHLKTYLHFDEDYLHPIQPIVYFLLFDNYVVVP